MDRSAWQALFNMGEMLRVGEGVEQDKAKAFQLFSASAAGGHFKAMHMMGLSFWFGWANREGGSCIFIE